MYKHINVSQEIYCFSKVRRLKTEVDIQYLGRLVGEEWAKMARNICKWGMFNAVWINLAVFWGMSPSSGRPSRTVHVHHPPPP
jgi:hypothetical protein